MRKKKRKAKRRKTSTSSLSSEIKSLFFSYSYSLSWDSKNSQPFIMTSSSSTSARLMPFPFSSLTLIEAPSDSLPSSDFPSLPDEGEWGALPNAKRNSTRSPLRHLKLRHRQVEAQTEMFRVSRSSSPRSLYYFVHPSRYSERWGRFAGWK